MKNLVKGRFKLGWYVYRLNFRNFFNREEEVNEFIKDGFEGKKKNKRMGRVN